LKLTPYLKEDKEHFLSVLAAAENMDAARDAIEEEWKRVLLTAGAEENDPRLTAYAGELTAVARAEAFLTNVTLEPEIVTRYKETGKIKKGHRGPLFWVMMLLGIAGIAAGGILFFTSEEVKPSFLLVVKLIMPVLAGMIFLFMAGREEPKRKGATGPEEVSEAILKPDGEKIYFKLLGVAETIDGMLEKAANGYEAENRKLTRSDIPEDRELKLFSLLLESAYADKQSESARDIVSRIRFHLHRHGVDVEDYEPGKADHFDLLPAGSGETMRPALVKDGTVLVRGLAFGKL